jgi:hypothetical protein
LDTGLGMYKKIMNKYHNLNWKLSAFVAQQIYKRPNQKVFEEMIKFMDKSLTAEQAVDIGFYYKFHIFLITNPFHFIKMAVLQLFGRR